MGLDQHAHLRNHKVDWDKYYSDDKEENENLFVFFFINWNNMRRKR